MLQRKKFERFSNCKYIFENGSQPCQPYQIIDNKRPSRIEHNLKQIKCTLSNLPLCFQSTFLVDYQTQYPNKNKTTTKTEFVPNLSPNIKSNIYSLQLQLPTQHQLQVYNGLCRKPQKCINVIQKQHVQSMKVLTEIIQKCVSQLKQYFFNNLQQIQEHTVQLQFQEQQKITDWFEYQLQHNLCLFKNKHMTYKQQSRCQI
eukprot:TRINITY_DN1851_c0_g1_i26.p3 TRINITY_DN1851_c0_g1~~TRINITY_DN1851_c0_g1_i26.p3  ORF type:complete len:201 (-),score=-18.12 TRINITY_DN1851_c0_g1_i26:537-1139(-)